MTDEEYHFRNRLVATYAAALEASHFGKSVQIRVGKDIAEKMKDFASIPGDVPMPAMGWGYPIVVDEMLPPDAIQVHSVTTVH